MKTLNRSLGKAGLAGAVLLSLAGCVVYDHPQPVRTVYVTTPPPAPQPAPVAETTPVVEATPPASASMEVDIRSESDFYEPLNPYGEWVFVGSVRCWRPTRVDAAWRPYSSGYWRRTDAGWYWASDEPWGWATYHYGRWDWNVRLGWVWVPQTQWAPAWVTWREGNGYIGWAPLPSTTRVAVGGTIEFSEAVVAPHFVFIEERHMLEPVHPRTVIVNNPTVINKTVNITKIKVVNKTVINEGPRTEVVERASGHKVEAVTVHDLRHKEETDFVARRRNTPPAPVERNITPPRREPEPVKAVQPHPEKPAEHVRESTPPSLPVMAREPRENPENKPIVTPEPPAPKPQPVIEEKKPELPTVAVKTETPEKSRNDDHGNRSSRNAEDAHEKHTDDHSARSSKNADDAHDKQVPVNHSSSPAPQPARHDSVSPVKPQPVAAKPTEKQSKSENEKSSNGKSSKDKSSSDDKSKGHGKSGDQSDKN